MALFSLQTMQSILQASFYLLCNHSSAFPVSVSNNPTQTAIAITLHNVLHLLTIVLPFSFHRQISKQLHRLQTLSILPKGGQVFKCWFFDFELLVDLNGHAIIPKCFPQIPSSTSNCIPLFIDV